MNVRIGSIENRNVVWKDVIVDILVKNPAGLTVSDIAEKAATSRHTVSVVLAELKGSELIRIRPVGIAKLHYWDEKKKKRKKRK